MSNERLAAGIVDSIALFAGSVAIAFATDWRFGLGVGLLAVYLKTPERK